MNYSVLQDFASAFGQWLFLEALQQHGHYDDTIFDELLRAGRQVFDNLPVCLA